MPAGALRVFGNILGSAMYRLDGRHRRIALDNLNQAFGETLPETEARDLVKACWRHFSNVTLGILALEKFGNEAFRRRHIVVEGAEHVREAHARGKGVLLFSGHFGHWELLALTHGFHFDGIPLSVVARPLDNPLLEPLLSRIRGLSGSSVIYKRNAAREMMRELRQGNAIGILIDQDARGDGVFVPFFGRPASTTPSLALLAIRTGAAVVPMACEPDGDRYRIRYEAPVEFERSEDRKEDVVRLTARCTAILEGWIRRQPSHWLWMHRRWKTEPPAKGAEENS
ncbi:hypothetical protein ABI59_01745 [Acidobacteria bacterium Mor1]|nr:hypothetical protein ABI59_01745 [Acidobacteria bacterium Mor1]